MDKYDLEELANIYDKLSSGLQKEIEKTTETNTQKYNSLLANIKYAEGYRDGLLKSIEMMYGNQDKNSLN